MPELKTATGPAHSAWAAAPGAATQIWIADYPQPEPPPPFTPNHPTPATGHGRVLLDLVSLRGAPLATGDTLPAAGSATAAFRATLIIETHTASHGQYFNIHGQARITARSGGHLCGTFDIGDADESAAGAFDLPDRDR